ncbi:MAG: Glycosyl transferase family 2/Galactosyltransferase [Rhodobacteraceae bacterium HLUCCA12]|nr:MAG: Glycosyl transferase family 2/Galactosyltransferase [Rhodobacteraceae bacterium HLUCCA12]
MYPFKTRNGARFFCRTDFTETPVLNLFFFDATRAQIPFHLSLRHGEGLAVINRHDGDRWHRELRWPMAFARAGGSVEIVFEGGAVRVSIEGRVLGRFDRYPRPDAEGRFFLRRGFPGLGGIAHVDLRGGWVPGSLTLAPPPDLSGLVLTDRLELLSTRHAQGDTWLAVDGLEAPLPMVRLPLPYSQGDQPVTALRCVLPGRIWADAGDSVVLRVVDGNGDEIGHMPLARAEVAARIEAMARAGGLEDDTLAALQAIEHCRIGGLFSRLGPHGRAGVAAAADRFGLSAWLFDGTDDDSGLDLAPPAPAPLHGHDAKAVDRACVRFTATMRQDPSTDAAALLAEIQRTDPLPSLERRILVLRLAEWFCAHADPRPLHALARDEGLDHFAPGDNIWHNTAVLPFLYLDGNPERVRDLLMRHFQPDSAWFVTPTIGWVATQAALNGPDGDGRELDAGARLGLIWAFLNFIEARAQDYWDRTACLSLTGAMVEMLVQGETFPRDLQARALSVALKVYALSPAFWRIVAERRASDWPDPPGRVIDTQTRFARLKALIEAGAGDGGASTEVDRLLADFERMGAMDAARFRRELLGPSGVAATDGDGPRLSALMATALDPDEAALRHLAYPHAQPHTPDPDLLEAARNAVPAAYERVARAPNGRLQARFARDAMDLLAAPADEASLKAFVQALAPLARAQSGWLGYGLGLSTAAGLARSGRDAGPVMLALREWLAALSPAERTSLAAATAPAMAMQNLRRHLPAADPVREQAEQEFGPLFAPLHGPADDRAEDLARHASPLFDTLVAVYSCRANLDSRVPAMRDGWLTLLEGLGVPFLVFVGGGDGRRDGDVVYLDAPDDYEGLPHKSVAMVRWVHDHTSFSHLLKIDDDCFLEPESFFLSLSHRKADYYGRPLHRVRGQMDRAWHMAKSRSPRGRLELDKSPEPSRYADGGSGYALSRRAMTALIDAADSAEGRALAQLSFMEDKLVGDLLAMRGIVVSGEDYRIAVMRRTRPGGPLVSAWENGFLPFAGSGIKLAHLDGHERQAEALALSRASVPQPSKVWPGYQPVRLGARSNTLDLISPVEKLARVNAAKVAVVACLRNEAFMLPHFLAHYRKLGVEGFLIADNGSDDGTLDLLAEAPDVALFSVDTEYSHSHYGVAWQQALLGNFRTGRWSVVADADELLFWRTDRGGNLPDLVDGEAFRDADAARLFMLDMYPLGSLETADFASGDPFADAGFCDRDPFLEVSGSMGPYTNAPVVTSALRHRLLPGSRAELFVAQKIALLKYRPWMRFSAGLHAVAEARLAKSALFFAHFKYNAAFRAKALAEVGRRQHFNNAEEYRKYLALIAEGRDPLYDPDVSVPFDQCAFVRRVCDAA